ncbi:MAG: hypothetical protein LBB90_09850 [Tannerella sp.]|jgi:hypothetical protein|nr:hypothetical protein [Tannerella sp.]
MINLDNAQQVYDYAANLLFENKRCIKNKPVKTFYTVHYGVSVELLRRLLTLDLFFEGGQYFLEQYNFSLAFFNILNTEIIMNNLNDSKKTIFTDGQISQENVKLLRDAIFDEEGITKAKAYFLFELKDTVGKNKFTAENVKQ